MPSNKNTINIDRWWPKWYSTKCSFQITMVHYIMIEWAIEISNVLWGYNNVSIICCHIKISNLHYGINHSAPKKLKMYFLLSKDSFGIKCIGFRTMMSSTKNIPPSMFFNAPFKMKITNEVHRLLHCAKVLEVN